MQIPAMTETKKKKHGPEPDRLKVEGDWTDAVGKALKKKRPIEGWPDPEDKKKIRPAKDG